MRSSGFFHRTPSVLLKYAGVYGSRMWWVPKGNPWYVNRFLSTTVHAVLSCVTFVLRTLMLFFMPALCTFTYIIGLHGHLLPTQTFCIANDNISFFFCISKCVISLIPVLCRTPDIFSHISPTTLQQSSIWRTNNFQQNFPHFFFHGSTAPSGSRPAHYQGFTITLRHTTVGRTPLEEWSARRRDIYLTHNTHKRHPCPRQDSNPPSQQVSGRRPKPQTARPLGHN